jgi:tRNA threonylcarbamoyladenosine biosynthesis protein TsaB
LLAIETCGKSGSVSLLQETPTGVTCASEKLDTNAGSAKTLAPAIAFLLQHQQITPAKLTAIALVSGPGSFTGLRVGVATSKALAYALGIPIVEVDGLSVIAFQVSRAYPRLNVVMDAYRGQVFHAAFRLVLATDTAVPLLPSVPRYERTQPTRIIDIDALLIELQQQDDSEEIVLCGPGCERMQRFLADTAMAAALPTISLSRLRWLAGEEYFPQAESVAQLAVQELKAGRTVDPFRLQPRYYRASAAEEKRSAAER